MYLHPLHNNISQGHRDKPRDGGTFCGTEGRVAGRRDEGGKTPGRRDMLRDGGTKKS